MDKAYSHPTQAHYPLPLRRPATPAEDMEAERSWRAGAEAPPLVERRETIPPADTNGSQPSDRIILAHRDTGEVLEYEEVRSGIYEKAYTDTDAQETRRQRYEMKTAVEAVLGTGSRQFKCQRARIDKTKDIEIKVSNDSGRAFFSGFQACGSVWLCAICGPKITERRRVEVSTAIEHAKAKGLKVMLLTLTVPHGMGDDVRVVLASMKKGWAKTSQGRKAHAMRQDTGFVGSIRVLEVTYGENGWHPHFHALLILDTEKTPDQVEAAWWPLWRDGCVKAGLATPSREHGITVQDGAQAAHYISKWGLESELTKGHLKKGKRSLSPWDLMRVMTFGTDHQVISSELRDTLQRLEIDKNKARALWIIYAKAFKGSRQLIWSVGLRDQLDVKPEQTDQEVAQADPTVAARTVATITNKQRIRMIRARAWSDVLVLAEHSPGEAELYLENLGGYDDDEDDAGN